MSASAPVRVAIVNDYELVLAGLAALLLPYGDRRSARRRTATRICVT